MPPNETFRSYSKIIQNKLACPGCSEDEKNIRKQLRVLILSVSGYLSYLGSDKIKEQFRNGSDFLLDCTVYPSQADCSDVGTISVELSAHYLVCLYLDFPIGMRIESVSMTFYIDSFNSGVTKYEVMRQWAVRSAGIAYACLEHALGTPCIIPSKSAPPGMETTVHIHPKATERLSHPYGKCVEASASEYNYDSCIMNCSVNRLIDKCNCVNLWVNLENSANKYCYNVTQTISELSEKLRCVKSAQARLNTECLDACSPRCLCYRNKLFSLAYVLSVQFFSQRTDTGQVICQ